MNRFNSVTAEFVLDENTAYIRILGEVRSDGGERLYAYGLEGFTAQLTVGGSVEYPLLDGLGSVRHLTDAAGTVILSRSYDAYGNVRLTIGMGATRLGYTGEMQDPASGLVYLRARHYQPTLGRFLQRDSFDGFIQGPQSLNRYVYAEGNPVVYVDPSGHYSVEELQRHFGVRSFEELQELFADGGKYAGFSGWYDILRAARNGDNVTSIHPFGPTSIHGTFMQLCDGEIVVNLGGRQLVPEFEIARFGGYWKGAADKGWGSDYGMYHLQGATVEIWATAISGRQMVNDMPCNTWDCVAIGIDLASVGYAYTSEAAFWSTPVTTVGGAAGFTYGKFAQVGTATAGVVWVEYQFQRGKASSVDVWVTRATASAGFVPFPVVSPVAATSQLLWDLLDPIHPW